MAGVMDTKPAKHTMTNKPRKPVDWCANGKKKVLGANGLAPCPTCGKRVWIKCNGGVPAHAKAQAT